MLSKSREFAPHHKFNLLHHYSMVLCLWRMKIRSPLNSLNRDEMRNDLSQHKIGGEQFSVPKTMCGGNYWKQLISLKSKASSKFIFWSKKIQKRALIVDIAKKKIAMNVECIVI